MIEEWKSLDDFPEYTFSNNGHVYIYKSNGFIGGTKDKDGYKMIGIRDKNNNKKYLRVSRQIYWLFGEKPEKMNEFEVDHIDRNQSNDTISNLRLATSKENKANQGKRQKNQQGDEPSSKYIGVCYYKQGRKWQSQIHVGKRFFLGRYKHSKNAGYVFNRVASCFKSPDYWFNALGDDFELPEEHENREYMIAKKIAEINHYLNN